MFHVKQDADTVSGLLDRLRASGWRVAVHNDYQFEGQLFTFYLFTHASGLWLKGEARSDLEALQEVARQATEHEMPGWQWADGTGTHWSGAVVYSWNGAWCWHSPTHPAPNPRHGGVLPAAAYALRYELESDPRGIWRLIHPDGALDPVEYQSADAAARQALEHHESTQAPQDASVAARALEAATKQFTSLGASLDRLKAEFEP